MTPELLSQYQSLKQGKAFVWHDDRLLLRFSGPDRAKFLHNFCTANVNALQIGDVCEAFVLDSRGKTLSFGHILQFESDLFWTAAGKEFAAELHSHFDKYIIREDVVVEDVSSAWTAAIESLATDLSESQRAESQDVCQEVGGVRTAIAEFAGLCRIHLIETGNRESLAQRLNKSLSEVTLDALTMLRLEYGTPWYGCEIDDGNLPQELRRDEKAISFTKGCYLGQETVAKIDAIGHVNRFMIGLKIDGDHVLPGAEIKVDDKKIGELRSVAWSPVLNSKIGIGYVKRQFAEPGTKVVLGDANSPGEVTALPVL